MKSLNKTAALMLLLFAGFLNASAISVTFHVDNADAVSMDYNGTTTVLAPGDNTFDFNEYDYLTFRGVSPWEITGVTNASGTPESVYSGIWYKSVYSTDNGRVYTITAKNLDATRTASCTVKVDDPTFVSATLSGTYSAVTLAAGENTVKFDPANENTLIVSSNNYQKPLYKVTLNGEDVESQGGTYYVALTQGCLVDIQAVIPAVPVTVNFSYSEDGKGAVSGVAVDNVDVPDFNGTSLTMTAGQNLTLYPNSDYSISGLTINGMPQSWYGGYSYNVTIMADTEIFVEAHKLGTVTVTINVNDPAQITLYRGYSYANDVIALTGTTNTVELPENNSMISWAAAQGCYIESVKVNGETYSGDNVTCTDGMVVEFATAAIVMDKTAAVWIDDRSLADQYFTFQSATREELGAAFTSGYNLVEFYSAYTPFLLSWYTANPVVGKVYINDELVSPMYEGSSNYELPLADRDVVKIFYAAEPVPCQVTFNVAEGIDPAVTRDIICPVADLAAPLSCFAGTQLDLAKAAKDFKVSVNGQPVSPLDGTADYRLTVTEPVTAIDIQGTTGIESVTATETASPAVYNLQGVKVADSLRGLPAGLYITGGRKVLVK